MKQLTTNDACLYISLLHQLEEESDFLLFEPGERQMTEERAKAMIETFAEQGNSIIFAEIREEELAGHLTCIGGQAKRDSHAVKLVVGVKKEYEGEGIATRLFEQTIQWAKGVGVSRLELMVMTHNERAIHLYKKFGFQIEGTRKQSLNVYGEWVDEYIMALILP